MKKEKKGYNENSYLIQINFGHFLKFEGVERAFNFLASKGRSEQTDVLCTSYKAYLNYKDVPKQTLELIGNINLLKYIADKYGLNSKSKEKVKELLESVDFLETPVHYNATAHHKTITFHLDNPAHKELYDVLFPMKNKEQIAFLTDIINVYLNTNLDEDYAQYEAEEILKSIAALYKYSKDDETFDKILKVLFIPVDLDSLPNYMFENDEEPSKANVIEALKHIR